MQNFEITFSFQGHRYLAEVSAIRGHDHIQYIISPQDENLLQEYGAQVIHEFSGRPLEAAFPGSTEEKKAYADALTAGLHRFLNSGSKEKKTSGKYKNPDF
jgi:hypothetical protein